MSVLTNWAGNYTYRAGTLHRPETIDELRRIVAATDRIHALGSRHSFNGIADSAELISLDRLDPAIEIDEEVDTVSVGGGVRYGDLALALEQQGYALHNMASLPHISVAGAVATATHGSGDRNGNLATAVVGIELVTSDGEIVRSGRGDADFPGMVVHLGALGVVTRLTLRIEPSYQVRQQVFEHLDWDVALERFEEIMGSATSVSLFTDYGATVNQVWRKQRVDATGGGLAEDYLGAKAAPARLHPVAAFSADGCTEQLDIPGAWLDRLPHFRMESMPSAGAEIQSEYMVPRANAVDAIRAIRALGDAVRTPLMISEIRSIAADDLWLSTAYEQDSIGLHFTWKREPDAVDAILPAIEAALGPLGARPHWGKHFLMPAAELSRRYERLGDFQALAARLDARGAFRNAFLEHAVFA